MTSSHSSFSKRASLLWVALCYGLCLSCAWAWLEWGPNSDSLLLDAFIADVVATLVIFGFSRVFQNSSFYDAYWSIAPPFFLGYWWWTRAEGADEIRLGLLAVVVGFWSLRLTLNWIIHWPGLDHEDWRYCMLRNKAPSLALVTDFFLIHLFPTGQVFLGILPLYAASALSTQPLNALDFVAFTIGIAAVTLEMLADIQLHRFIAQRSPGEVMDRGLWAYSRHPNYFGEFMFWLSLSLFGLAALPEQWWWNVLGALAILIMFLTASIPMMERKLSSKPGYQAVINRVSMFVPWPPKKA